MRARMGVLVLALAGDVAAAPQTPPPPVFTVRLETVYIDALVTRDGRPLPGLNALDFELKVDGVVQKVELAALEALPLLAVLAFDTSQSVAGEKLAALQTAGDAFLESLRPIDEVGLLSFSTELAWLAGPTRDRAQVRRALQGLRAEGATAVLDAVYTALVLPETKSRMLVVVFSDGMDNTSWLDTPRLKLAAERSTAVVHSVTLWDPTPIPMTRPAEPAHIRILREVSETTGGRLWGSASPAGLKNAFTAIAEAMRMRYVLRYDPPGVARPGWHRIELRLRGTKGDVHARRGYWASGR